MRKSEACSMCSGRAVHKIGEEIIMPNFHNLTNYLCCEHFRTVVGDCSTFPYEYFTADDNPHAEVVDR